MKYRLRMAMLLVFSLVTCLQSWADGETFTEGRITYRVIGTNRVEVESISNNNDPITIPATTQTGYQVVKIAHFNVYIPSVTLSEGLEEIGAYAFNGCNLTSITLPNSLRIIGQSAFDACKFTSITIPNNVTTIGESAFGNCKKLEVVNIGSGVTTIGVNAFYGAGTEVTREEGFVINWGNNANIITLGESVFYGCTTLKSFTIPAGIKEIPARTFGNCPSLTEITIPATVEKVWGLAFVGGGIRDEDVYMRRYVIEDSTEPIIAQSGNLTAVDVFPMYYHGDNEDPNNYVYMGRDVVHKNSNDEVLEESREFWRVDHIVIGSEVTTITRRFTSGSQLKCITFSEGSKLTSVGYQAFTGQTSLTSVILPDGVSTIGEQAFKDCTSLNTFHIPTSLTVIPESMLNHTAITELVIPANVTTIGENAFTSTTHLASMTIEDSNTALNLGGWYLNNQSPLTTLYIGRNLNYTSGWGSLFPNLTQVTFGSQVTALPSDPAWLFNNVNGITDVYAPWTTPIEIVEATFTSTVYANATLHVPGGTGALYQAATGWKNFTHTTWPEYVTLDITATGNGLLTIGDTNVENQANVEKTVDKGSDVVITIAADANYEVGSLEVDGTDVTAGIVNDTYTIDDIADNATIVATFVVKKEHITISAAEQGTFCSAYDLDFSSVPEIKVYIASGYIKKTGTILLTRVTDVPAGTGLYVKGSAATYDIPYTTSTAYYANMLKGNVEATNVESTEGEFTNFFLTPGTGGLGFYEVKSTLAMPANRSVLQIPTSLISTQSSRINLMFDDEETNGIGSMQIDDEDTTNNNWFTIDGRRMNGKPNQKGIYISNGKKIVIK